MFTNNRICLATTEIYIGMEKIEKIPAWIERLLLPKLNEISGGIKALEAKIESVDNKVDVRIGAVEKEIASFRSETLTKFEAVDDKIEGLRMEVTSRFDSIEARIPVMEKIAELEVRLADCVAF